MEAAFDGASAGPYLPVMGQSIAWATALVAVIFSATPPAAAPAPGDPADRSVSGSPAGSQPFFRHGDPFPNMPGAGTGLPSSRPEAGPDDAIDSPVPPRGAETDKPVAPPAKPPSRAEILDKLLSRLAAAQDADEAKGIASLVEHMWLQSGSDTADLLMTRAVTAMNGERRDVAAALLDKIIDLQPGWAEAWNRRATLRYLEDDDAGAMEDISHVLVLEPRHFGALSGMGFILERHGEHAAALKALRRALAVYPQDTEIRKAVDKLAPTVEGEDL